MRQFYEFFAGLTVAQVKDTLGTFESTSEAWRVHTLSQQSDGTFFLLLERTEQPMPTTP